jgi:hypothetical protein
LYFDLLGRGEAEMEWPKIFGLTAVWRFSQIRTTHDISLELAV